MGIKRTSYFTFLVAITTLAALGSCVAMPNGQSGCGVAHSSTICPEELYSLYLEGLLRLEGELSDSKITHVNAAAKLQFKVNEDGTVGVYIVVDKNFKGLAQSHCFHARPTEAETFGFPVALPAESGFCIDQRPVILAKNRILLI
ncbi:MAG: hypothetical protein QM642_10965 [Edaphocola sp.]